MVQTACVFPGQGSQSVGMLADCAPHYNRILETFSESSEAVGYDVWQLIQNGPEEQLNQTEHTQVAMLTSDVALYRVLRDKGLPMPEYMAGHSLGEYAALVCAESLSLSDAVRLVSRRGQLMQEAIPLGVGAMAAIVGLSEEEVESLCARASQEGSVVTPANFNAIGQTVVAGHTKAVQALIELAEQAEARLAKIIPVSVPCHCSLLKDAAEVFSDNLMQVDFKQPKISVVSNVDLSIYHSADHIRTQLKKQLYSPVRWVETIQLFKNNGVGLIIECGPAKVLSGLIKRIDKTLETVSVYDRTSVEQVSEQLKSLA